MEVKKNDDEQGKESDKNDSFPSWGGEAQQAYERLRSLAFGGGDGAQARELVLFTKCGMSLFVPEYLQGFWTVKRVRAPVRAGELCLKEFLGELRILRNSPQSGRNISSKELCV